MIYEGTEVMRVLFKHGGRYSSMRELRAPSQSYQLRAAGGAARRWQAKRSESLAVDSCGVISPLRQPQPWGPGPHKPAAAVQL